MDAAATPTEKLILLKQLLGGIPEWKRLQFARDVTSMSEEPPVEQDYSASTHEEDIAFFSTQKKKIIADMKKYDDPAASGGPFPQDPTKFKGQNWERTSYFGGICTTSVLSLFLDLRVPDNKTLHVALPVGCQPDINAKRFTEPLNASPALSCPHATAVVYKAVNPKPSSTTTSEDSKTPLHRIQPMNVSDPSLSTVHGNQIAENLCLADFDSAYQKLLGMDMSDIIGKDKSPCICFLVLIRSINATFNLQEEKGWRDLLKRLGVIVWKDNALANLKALALSGPQVKQCAILAFSSVINVKTAFLTGEGVMLGMKDFLLQDTNEFQVARHMALDIITPSTFGGNATFCPKVLKELSHDLCRSLSCNMSKTGSLADFIMQKALKDANSATASDLSTQTTLEEDDYTGKLAVAQERALGLLSDNKRHNPHVQAIFQNFVVHNANTSTTTGSTSTTTSMDNSAAALIKVLMPKINIQYSPHANRKTAREFFWVVGLLTQWEEQSSAKALFSVLQRDEKASD
jgi:hypothetical protein